MLRPRSTFPSAVLAALALALPARARAQACCAGAGTVTPARLSLHEDALVGVQARASTVLGSFDGAGKYVPAPSGATEYDFEQDVFGAVRLLDHAQLAVLVPFVETHRALRGASESGGGLGDANASARYDVFPAGRSRYVPGVALLAGVTFPTGRPVEAAEKPLATDATGVGALQGSVGLALEQTFGPWLFGATALVARRAPRVTRGIDETLGTQVSLLGAAAYTFPGEAALAFFASYTVEGNATIDGMEAVGSARRGTLVGLGGLVPLGEAWRALGSASWSPPLSSLGKNQPATGGLALTLIRSWS